MIAVIFEVVMPAGNKEEYLEVAQALRPLLATIDGFISIERYESLTGNGKILSLSFWRDEAAVAEWRQTEQHRKAQVLGREQLFDDYRLRIAHVIRDYGMEVRNEAPDDSKQIHGE